MLKESRTVYDSVRLEYIKFQFLKKCIEDHLLI